jgi:predicted HicB family RNase H-like nuclease
MARPREFDGPPVSVRLTTDLHDALSLEAIRRGVDLAKVIRERLAVSQNSGNPGAQPQ